MDDVAEQVLTALAGHKGRESYEVRTFSMYRHLAGARTQKLTVRLLEGAAGERGGLANPFVAEAERSDGLVVPGRRARTAGDAIASIPWARLDPPAQRAAPR